jgi:hypothetical protein
MNSRIVVLVSNLTCISPANKGLSLLPHDRQPVDPDLSLDHKDVSHSCQFKLNSQWNPVPTAKTNYNMLL